METTLLSASDSPVESNEPVAVEPAQVIEPKPEPEPEKPGGEAEPAPKEEPVEEVTIDLDGQRYTATQIREMKKDAENRKDWQRTNTQQAQKLAEKERRLARLELLEEAVNKNPDVLQTIFRPVAPQNFEADYRAHLAKRPVDRFSPEHDQWEEQKDILLSQGATREAEEKATQRIFKAEADTHNQRIANEAEKRFRANGRDENQILEMGQWVYNNIKPTNGKYPENAFDVAERFIFSDEDSRSAKLEGARSAAASIRNAKPAGEATGVNKKPEPKTPQDEDDDKFVELAKLRGDH